MFKEILNGARVLNLNFSKKEMIELDSLIKYELQGVPTGIQLAWRAASTHKNLHHIVETSALGGTIFEYPNEDSSVFTCPLEDLPLKLNTDSWIVNFIAKWRMGLAK